MESGLPRNGVRSSKFNFRAVPGMGSGLQNSILAQCSATGGERAVNRDQGLKRSGLRSGHGRHSGAVTRHAGTGERWGWAGETHSRKFRLGNVLEAMGDGWGEGVWDGFSAEWGQVFKIQFSRSVRRGAVGGQEGRTRI